MRKVIVNFFIAALIFNSAAYAQISTCKMAKLMEKELVQLNRERGSLRSLQEQYLEAKRIQEQLADPESSRDILMLAERFQAEIDGLEDRQHKQYTTGAASVGAIILSGYFIKKMSQSTKGLALKKRVARQLKPTGPGGAVRTLTNSVFFLGTLSSLWMVYSIHQTHTKIEMLAAVIDKLNKLKDLSSQIEKLGDDIIEIKASYDLMVDDIIFQELGSIGQNGLLSCD